MVRSCFFSGAPVAGVGGARGFCALPLSQGPALHMVNTFSMSSVTWPTGTVGDTSPPSVPTLDTLLREPWKMEALPQTTSRGPENLL